MAPTVGMKRSNEGYRTAQRLQQQLAHLTELLHQQQQHSEEAHRRHMLLAHAIVMYRAVHHFLQPLYRLWLQPDASDGNHSSHSTMLLSQVPLVQSDPNWKVWVQLAVALSPMTRRSLMVTPEAVRTAAQLSPEDAHKLTRECVTRLVMLGELLSPDRYPRELLSAAGEPAPAAESGAAPADSGVAPSDITEAAEQLLSRLKEYQALMDKVSISVAVLLAHQPQALWRMAAMNMETGKESSPPGRHFFTAAKRLGLARWQLQELVRIRQLLLRLSSQAHVTGMQLVGASAHSLSLQASLSGTSSSCTPPISALGVASAQSATPATQDAQQQRGLEGSEQCLEEGADVEQVALEQLMQKHLRNLHDLVYLEGNWVATVLTPWQHGMYMAACWPFWSRLGALAELAPFLTPVDTPAMQINAHACETAAEAAALGAELGFTGAHELMEQRRCDALEAQLAWVLQAGHVL